MAGVGIGAHRNRTPPIPPEVRVRLAMVAIRDTVLYSVRKSINTIDKTYTIDKQEIGGVTACDERRE